MAKKKDAAAEQLTTITPPDAGDVKLSAHPRAARAIPRIKSYGGIAGFALMAWLSHRSGTDFVHLALRALIGGLAAYVVTWAAAVYIWRQIVIAEIRAKARVMAERKFAALDAAEQ